MELGYARVSTSKQDLDRQITTLHEHGIRDALLWVDKRTGAHTDREGLAGILAAAQSGDTIVTCTLDRLGRNLRDCLNLVHDLSQRGVQLRTLHDPLPIDTADTSAMAQISTAMLALFSEVERVFSQERAAHARSVREAKGVPAGRRRKLSEQQLAAAQAQVEAGVPVPQVAATFQVSRSSMYRLLGERGDLSTPAEAPHRCPSTRRSRGSNNTASSSSESET